MVRPSRRFRCSACNKIYKRQQDICSCGDTSTLIDVTPGMTEAQKKASENRRIRQRSKNAERRIAKTMAITDGEDSNYDKVASKHGRIGFITNMRVDAVSRSYVTEAKNRKLPVWLIKAWVLLQQKGRDFDKNILLYLQPPNLPLDIPYGDGKVKGENMHVILESRHQELIKKEKALGIIFLSHETKTEMDEAIEAARSILADK